MTENKQRAVGGRGDGGAALCLQAHLQLPVSAHVRSGLQFHPLITAAASDHKILIQQVKMISIQIGSGVIIGLNLLQDVLLIINLICEASFRSHPQAAQPRQRCPVPQLRAAFRIPRRFVCFVPHILHCEHF